MFAIAAPTTNAQSIFNLTSFNAYVNTPSTSSEGTLLVSNKNPRPTGSSAYVTGVAVTAMPAYAAGETMQWAILARSTKASAAVLKFGVQSGTGDANTLSISDTSMTVQPGGFQWIVSTARVVNVFKPNLYLYIPDPLGQEIEIRDLILGSPTAVANYIATRAPANRLFNPAFQAPDPTVPLGTQLTGVNSGISAAQKWNYADNGDKTVPHTTELLPTTLPGGVGLMLHVVASGVSDGPYQYFMNSSATGISEATVSAWVYVVSGQVTLYSGRAGVVVDRATTTTTGQWEHLQFSTGSHFITGVFIYAALGAASGAEYYIANASVTANSAPRAHAGTDQSVNELDPVVLDGSDSSDADLDPLTYSWTQILGSPTVTLFGADTAQPTFTAPDLVAHSGGTTLTFRVTVSDGKLTGQRDVNVRVSSVNHVPLADAGPDQSVAERSEVTLNGANSADTDGDSLTYSWTQIGGPAVTLANANSATATFAAPTVGVTGATLTFQLTVDDGYGGVASDTVIIDVSYANRSPSVEAGPAQTANEGDVVALAGSASDPDNNQLTYSWSQISGPAITLSDIGIAAPTFVAPAVTRDEADVVLALSVSDGYGGSATDSVTIHVANINHAPTAEAPANFTTPEGSEVALAGVGNDPDAEEQSELSYGWEQIAGPTVTLNSSGANVSFAAPLVTAGGDPNAKETLSFRLTVTDPNGATATDDVDVTVTNVDHSPAADAGGSLLVNEASSVLLNGANSSDPDGDALTYAWTQIDGPIVALKNANAAMPSFTAPFVNSAGAILKFRLTVNDGFGGSSSDTATVTVANINDPPSIAAARASLSVLWSPDHRMVPVSIVGVTDANNNAVVKITSVTQDEATNGLGDGDTPVDAIINADGTALLRAERAGTGDGRVYRVGFTASDFEGSVSGVVNVGVPKSKKTDAAIDTGAVFDSTR